VYGALAEVSPGVTAAAGLPFGAVFWLLADEISVPLLGLAKGPTAYPVSTHVYALASHLVYGVTAEIGRRAVRQVL
jgi:putative membrane protein